MSRIPPFDPKDLRESADDAVVERVWARLSTNLPAFGPPARSGTRSVFGVRSLAFAAAAGVFGLGLVVGQHVSFSGLPEASVSPSFDGRATDVFAAGTRQRSFALPGGSVLSLQPESVVEVVELRDGAVKLHLLRGRASLDASAGTLDVAFIAGEALVSAPAGSVMSLARGTVDVDVLVERGSVEVNSPAGRQVMRGGEASRVPIVTVVSTRPEPEPEPRDLAPRSDGPDEPAPIADNASEAASEVPVVVALSWLDLAQSDKFDDAYRVLEERGGMQSAVVSVQSVRELFSLSDIAMAKSKNALAIQALRRVADEFASDPQASAAAFTLANLYAASGNEELSAKYRAQAIKSKQLGEVLLCGKLRGTARDTIDGRAQAAAIAAEYLQRYPDSSCADEAKMAVEEASTDAPSKPVTPGPTAAPPNPAAPSATAPNGTPAAPSGASKPGERAPGSEKSDAANLYDVEEKQ